MPRLHLEVAFSLGRGWRPVRGKIAGERFAGPKSQLVLQRPRTPRSLSGERFGSRCRRFNPLDSGKSYFTASANQGRNGHGQGKLHRGSQ